MPRSFKCKLGELVEQAEIEALTFHTVKTVRVRPWYLSSERTCILVYETSKLMRTPSKENKDRARQTLMTSNGCVVRVAMVPAAAPEALCNAAETRGDEGGSADAASYFMPS
jgi:hypothetical protein